MTKTEYINKTLLVMNEAGMMDIANATTFTGADSIQLDRQIESSYADAWRRCVKVMPRLWFKNESFKTATKVEDLQSGTGYIILPDDFYLLTTFRMQGWKKPAHEASVENDRVESIQSNEYTRGSNIRPVCTISIKSTPNGIKNTLSYYSLKKGAPQIVEEAIYLPVPTGIKDLDPDTELGLSEQVIEPMIYLSASTVFTMYEKYDIAKALEGKAVEMFPGLQTKNGTVRQ